MNNRQKYRFVVARFRPNQLRGEFVNIGVIVHVMETKEIMSRWLPDLGRMRCLSQKVTFDQYEHFRKELTRYIPTDHNLTLLESDNLTVPRVTTQDDNFLEYLHREWSIPFCFSEPVGGFTANPETQLHHLYNQVVAVGEEKKERQDRTMAAVRRKIGTELRQKELLGEDKLHEHILVKGLSRDWQFDYGRVNGSIVVVEAPNLYKKDAVEKSNAALIFSGQIQDVIDTGKDVKAFAVVSSNIPLGRREGIEPALKLLTRAKTRVEVIEENQLSALSRELQRYIGYKVFTF
jgi:hypothetical protein